MTELLDRSNMIVKTVLAIMLTLQLLTALLIFGAGWDLHIGRKLGFHLAKAESEFVILKEEY